MEEVLAKKHKKKKLGNKIHIELEFNEETGIAEMAIEIPETIDNPRFLMGTTGYEVVTTKTKPSKDKSRFHFNISHQMLDKNYIDLLMEIKCKDERIKALEDLLTSILGLIESTFSTTLV
jgi:hypothetical protein